MDSIIVNNQPTVQLTVNNDIVCIGGTSLLSSSITNGSGVYNYQWQSSPTGAGSWTNVAVNGTSATYNAPTNTLGTTYYRLFLTDLSNGCEDPLSNILSVTITAQGTVDINADNVNLCVGGSSTITSTVTNGSGLFNYQWQSSPDGLGGWANITLNGNSANYTVPTAIAGTTFYRVIVTDLANNCNDPVSDVVEVIINPSASVSIAATNEIICVGGTSVINPTITNGSGVYLYQWQSSPDGSSWAHITSGGTSATYNVPSSVAGTTYYRLLFTDLYSGCCDPVSNAITVVIAEQVELSISVENSIVCLGGVALIVPDIDNGSGVYSYQWQSSPDGNNPWTDITFNGNS